MRTDGITSMTVKFLLWMSQKSRRRLHMSCSIAGRKSTQNLKPTDHLGIRIILKGIRWILSAWIIGWEYWEVGRHLFQYLLICSAKFWSEQLDHRFLVLIHVGLVYRSVANTSSVLTILGNIIKTFPISVVGYLDIQWILPWCVTIIPYRSSRYNFLKLMSV